jgi:hypothetical protein
MIRRAISYLLLAVVVAGIVGGCLHLADKISRDRMEEELESWEAGDQEWLKQLFEERRREFMDQMERKHS